MPKQNPYIPDQAWRLLVDFDNPRHHLTSAKFRAGRASVRATAESAEAEDAWIDVTAQQVLTGNWLVAGGEMLHPQLRDGQGQFRPARRVVLTSDAGVGKTTTTEWLGYRLGLPDLAAVPLVVPLRVLEGDEAGVEQRLQTWLVAEVRRWVNAPDCDTARAWQCLEQSRRRGRLALLFDGLDQTPGAIVNLSRVLQSPYYADCRVFVAGRPYSLQRHWNELFEQRDWLFVRVEEFSVPQQRAYLGTTAENASRWTMLPEDARQILGTPRVLQYVRTIADAELPRLRTAADVYVRAVDELLRQGMAKSSDARLLGWKTNQAPAQVDPQNLSEGWKLLGAIAMEMTTQQIVVADPKAAPGTRRVPNFDRVPAGTAFDKFKKQMAQRYQSLADVGLPQDLKALAALNDVIEHGVFDTDLQGLQEVQFRNRSLQEFLCAYYLATEAFTELPLPGRTAERVAADEAWLETNLYLPDRPETEEYYHVWQFLADMPAESRDNSGRPIRGRNNTSWLRAIAPLYRPAKKVKTGWFRSEWRSQRSSEMIYRSWWSLQACYEQGLPAAKALRDTWLGEFQ
ncbi:MAG: NACHT domain-containing protein, partial [Planctomycetaceae bacterium]